MLNKFSKYFISLVTQKTPNPNFKKFIAENVVVSTETIDIPDKKYSNISPLATQLFDINGVNRVFFGTDYISIGKKNEMEWNDIEEQVKETISLYLKQKLPIFIEEKKDQIDENDSEVVKLIKEILDSKVVQEDGGDIEYTNFDEESGVLTVRLKGACVGCSSSSITLKQGVEKMMVYYVEEVKEVIQEEEDI